MSGVKEFFGFVNERHQIWHRRFVLQQSYPWTQDPILRHYKFTNVYRELDRGTKFLWENISKETHEKWWQVIAFRFLNNVDAFMATAQGLPTLNMNLGNFGKRLHRYKEENEHVFSTAYRTICNVPRGSSRIDAYIDILYKCSDQQWLENLINTCVLEESYRGVHGVLKREIKHVGEFLAYELLTDLRHLDTILRVKFSENEWANFGPGARVGLKYIYGKDFNQEEAEEKAVILQSLQEQNLPTNFPYYDDKPLTLRNIEHSLCEFGKYMNIKNNVGRNRPIYYPTLTHHED